MVNFDLITSDLEDELDAEDEAKELAKEKRQKQKSSSGLTRSEVALLRGKFDFDAERTVFVGNCPVDATAKELKRLFSKFGQVESVRVRNAVGKAEKMPKKVAAIQRENIHPEINRINCFVKFVDKSSVEKSFAL